MKTIEYQCYLCGKPGKLSYDENTPLDVSKWAKFVRCDNCVSLKRRMNAYKRFCRQTTIGQRTTKQNRS